jgi:hypothetical protein
MGQGSRYSVCLLSWYKRTNTDAEGAASRHDSPIPGTEVQILTQLLCWYRSTNTDAAAAGMTFQFAWASEGLRIQVLYGLKLLVYEALSY